MAKAEGKEAFSRRIYPIEEGAKDVDSFALCQESEGLPV